MKRIMLTLALLSGGCVPVDVAAEHASQQAVNAYGLSQRGSSESVRTFGANESFAWRTQHQILTGEDVPAPQGVVWEPLPAAVESAHCPSDERAGLEHCGCPAPSGPCVMPCTGCCEPEGCPCVNPPTSGQ